MPCMGMMVGLKAEKVEDHEPLCTVVRPRWSGRSIAGYRISVGGKIVRDVESAVR